MNNFEILNFIRADPFNIDTFTIILASIANFHGTQVVYLLLANYSPMSSLMISLFSALVP